jgi:hypothetical protein
METIRAVSGIDIKLHVTQKEILNCDINLLSQSSTMENLISYFQIYHSLPISKIKVIQGKSISHLVYIQPSI